MASPRCIRFRYARQMRLRATFPTGRSAHFATGIATRLQIGLEPCNGGTRIIHRRQHAAWITPGLDQQPLVIALQQQEEHDQDQHNPAEPAANGQPYSLYCAVIVKTVDAQTRSKTSINDLLRP